MKLYKLTDEAKKLIALDDMSEEAITDTLEAMGLHDKFDSLAKVIRSMDGAAKAYAEEVKYLQGKVASEKNKIESLKNYARNEMNKIGLKKAGTTHGFSLSEPKTPSVLVIDKENYIPRGYKSAPEPVLDRRALIAALKEGKIAKHCHLELAAPTLRVK